MHIAVNGKSLGQSDRGGSERAALMVLLHAARRRPDITFHVYMPIGTEEPASLPPFPENVRLRLSRFGLYKAAWARALLWEQFIFPLLVWRNRDANLVFHPVNSSSVLLPMGLPQVLVLHDIGYLNREWFSGTFSRYIRLVVWLAIRRRMRFVTDSAAAAAEILKAYPSLPEVTTIPLASDDPPAPLPPPPADYGYILFLGNLNPRKNITGAIEGFNRFKAETGRDLRLAVIGADKAIFKWEGPATGAGEDVVFLGYRDGDEKWAWLAHAEALILPSFLESFCLPVLEALNVRVPVVASDIGPFRELYDDALEYVDPYSPDDIGRGLASVLCDEERQNTLRDRGTEIAARYAWPETARRYIELFEAVAGNGEMAP